MPELAKTARIDEIDGNITIDGQEFPWYVAEGGVSVANKDSEAGQFRVLTLSILVDGEVSIRCTDPENHTTKITN